MCHVHGYYGQPIPGPTEKCKQCGEVYLRQILATKSGDYQANLDELEAIIHAMVELDEEGLFDYKPYKHPQIEKI